LAKHVFKIKHFTTQHFFNEYSRLLTRLKKGCAKQQIYALVVDQVGKCRGSNKVTYKCKFFGVATLMSANDGVVSDENKGGNRTNIKVVDQIDDADVDVVQHKLTVIFLNQT
jgi:hypothetical protein